MYYNQGHLSRFPGGGNNKYRLSTTNYLAYFMPLGVMHSCIRRFRKLSSSRPLFTTRGQTVRSSALCSHRCWWVTDFGLTLLLWIRSWRLFSWYAAAPQINASSHILSPLCSMWFSLVSWNGALTCHVFTHSACNQMHFLPLTLASRRPLFSNAKVIEKQRTMTHRGIKSIPERLWVWETRLVKY